MTSANSDDLQLPMDPDVGRVQAETVLAGHRRLGRVPPVIVLALACGGAVGAVSRYAITLALPPAAGHFPWSTFLVNVTGSAALGFLLVLLPERFPHNRLARPVIGTGVIGAYTTFSTYMVDVVVLVRDGHPATAALYLGSFLLIGLLSVWLGIVVARSTFLADPSGRAS